MNRMSAIIFSLLIFCNLSLKIYAQEETGELQGQAVKTMTVGEVADFYKISVEDFINAIKSQSGIRQIKADSSFQLLHDNYGLAPSDVKEIAESVAGKTALQSNESASQTQIRERKAEKDYYLPAIGIALVSLYIFSLFLVRNGKLQLVSQRKIWNLALASFFLSTALLGILLVVRISHGVTVPLPFNMLFWHVETGIAFSVIALFHAFWHLSYFKAVFRKTNISK